MTGWVYDRIPSSGGPVSVVISTWIALAIAKIFCGDGIIHRLYGHTNALPCSRIFCLSAEAWTPERYESKYRYEPPGRPSISARMLLEVHALPWVSAARFVDLAFRHVV
jgi:hypothetical protein